MMNVSCWLDPLLLAHLHYGPLCVSFPISTSKLRWLPVLCCPCVSEKFHAMYLYVYLCFHFFGRDSIFMIKNESFWHAMCTCQVPCPLYLLGALFLFRGIPLITLLHALMKIFFTSMSRYSYWFMRCTKERIALWIFKDKSGLQGHLF